MAILLYKVTRHQHLSAHMYIMSLCNTTVPILCERKHGRTAVRMKPFRFIASVSTAGYIVSSAIKIFYSNEYSGS